LTPKEFELFQVFMRHPRQVLVRDRLLEEVWGYDFGGEDNVLEVYIGYLRKKTEAAGEARLIQTVRGVGYVLREA
jgi:two-component system response regulator MprA